MSNAGRTILGILSRIAVLGLFIGFLSSIIYFILNPTIFHNYKNVTSYLFEFLLLGGITRYLVKRIKKGIEDHGSISKAITILIIDEPLLHSMIWIFIIFQMFVFIYILPIHYLLVEVNDGSRVVESNIVNRIKVLSGKKNIALEKSSETMANYESKRLLAWGDSIEIRIDAKGYENYSELIAWPGLAFLEVLSGVKTTVNLIRAKPVKISLLVSPSTAQVEVRSPTLDMILQGSGNFEIQKNEIVELTASAINRANFDTTFVVKNDIELIIILKPLGGTVVLRAFTEGGKEIPEMDIFIDGEKILEKSGDTIRLLPGNYIVYMEKLLSEDEKAVVDKFSVKIISNKESIVNDIIIRIEHP